MTQLTEKECGICGLAIAKCSILSQLGVLQKPWIDATEDEMQAVVKKLELIQQERNEDDEILKVTNKETGKSWIEKNINHSWSDLALEIIRADPDVCLVYCDIECLQRSGNSWKLLDECGNWVYLPEKYAVEPI
jgi:hypothetical protein